MKPLIFLIVLFLSYPALAEVYTEAEAKYPPDKEKKRQELLKQYDAETLTEVYMKLPQRDQVLTIQRLIDRYRMQGITPKLVPIEYVRMIDNLMEKNLEYVKVPLKQIFEEILQAEGSLPKEG